MERFSRTFRKLRIIAPAVVAIGGVAQVDTVWATSFAAGVSGPISASLSPGAVIEDVLRAFTITFSRGETLSGIVQDRVVVQGDGTLVFNSAIRDLTGAKGAAIDMEARAGFFDATIDVTYDPSSIGTLGPSSGQRDLDLTFMRSSFGLPGVEPGGAGSFNTTFVDIDTNDRSYALGTHAMFLTGHSSSGEFGTVKIDAFIPTPVPEPEVTSIMLLGLTTLAWISRRRRALRNPA